jgi:hypothetical protein
VDGMSLKRDEENNVSNVEKGPNKKTMEKQGYKMSCEKVAKD